MNIAESIFKISFISKNQISEHGDIGVFENIFRIEKTTSKNDRMAYVTYQPLLTDGDETEYIDINDAAELTGLGIRKLKDLCEKGKLEYLIKGKNWLIQKESLEKYI